MVIKLLIHLEAVNVRRPVWWAESPDLPGFSATDAALRELLSRSRWVIEEILEERGVKPTELVLAYELVKTTRTENPVRASVEGQLPASQAQSDASLALVP